MVGMVRAIECLPTGWGLVWKLLLSRLGLFREMFSDGNGKKDDKTKRRDSSDVAMTTEASRTAHHVKRSKNRQQSTPTHNHF